MSQILHKHMSVFVQSVIRSSSSNSDFQVYKKACFSRIVILILQYFFNLIIPDHVSEDAFQTKIETSFAFEGLCRWDSQYFIEIATNGYSHDYFTVFFPGFPILVKTLSEFIRIDVQLTGLFLNNFVFFPWAAVFVRQLERKLKTEESWNSKISAADLFILSPANIFFSSFYTESMFAFSTFGMLVFLDSNNGNLFFALVFALISQITRSNGIVNIGFFLYRIGESIFVNRQTTFNRVFKICVCCVIQCLPFLFYQKYVSDKFCSSGSSSPGWCQNRNSFTGFTFSYGHFQTNVWENGFMRYWQLKKIPNFLLFAPTLFFSEINHKLWISNSISLSFYFFRLTYSVRKSVKIIFSNELFMYGFHLKFLVLYCLCFMHIEVGSRLIMSSTPIFYLCYSEIDHKYRVSSMFSNLFCKFSILYTFLGLILHTNWYPWT